MAPLVLLEQSNSSATLTLNRPDKHNALIPELLHDLNDSLAELKDRTDLRSVVLQAKGRSFSTGGDVKAFWDQSDRIPYSRDLVGALNDAIMALLSLPCPLLANIHGPITGGSIGLMLAADLVAISPKTFAQPYYCEVGFAPDGGWAALLPDRIGHHQTGRILALNERLTADKLIDLGLADACTENPTQQISDWQEQLCQKVYGSLKTGKKLLHSDRLEDYRQALEKERQAFLERIIDPETEAGMKRFLNIS